LFELEHPAGVGRVGVAFFVLALGLNAEEAGGVIENGFLGLFAVFLPGGVAEFIEVWGFAADSDIFADEVGLFNVVLFPVVLLVLAIYFMRGGHQVEVV
jgi:hypothetical protein